MADERLCWVVFKADGSIAAAHAHGDPSSPCRCEWPVEAGGTIVMLPGLTDQDAEEAWEAFTRPDSFRRGGWTPEQVKVAFRGVEDIVDVPDLGPVPPDHERRFHPLGRVIHDAPTRALVESMDAARLNARMRGLPAPPRPLAKVRHVFPRSGLFEALVAPFVDAPAEEE